MLNFLNPFRLGWRRMALFGGLLFLAILPSYLHAYSIASSSHSPNYIHGDLVLTNLSAYDLRLPYTDVVLFSLSDPQLGEIVVFNTEADDTYIKRVVAGPGDTLEMRDYRLLRNGKPLVYDSVDETELPDFGDSKVGSQILEEVLVDDPYLISFTPSESAEADFGPVQIPEDRYFLMGDFRSNSRDSRHFGPVPRERIRGRLMGRLFR